MSSLMRNSHDTGPEGKKLNSYAAVAPNFIKKEIKEVTTSCVLKEVPFLSLISCCTESITSAVGGQSSAKRG